MSNCEIVSKAAAWALVQLVYGRDCSSIYSGEDLKRTGALRTHPLQARAWLLLVLVLLLLIAWQLLLPLLQAARDRRSHRRHPAGRMGSSRRPSLQT
jgi:di/tricarboxylate transporter